MLGARVVIEISFSGVSVNILPVYSREGRYG